MRAKFLIPFIALIMSASLSQEKWLLRFSLREGMPLNWHIRMVTKKVANKQSEIEVAELWVREQVEQIRPNGNLVWSSQTVRCVVNGEVVPVDKTERTVSELTPLGYPARPIALPPPSLHQLDDWLLDLFGGVSLVFPPTEVGVGDKWHYQLAVGLKPPNEPRWLTVNYRLEGREKVGKRDCLRISVQLNSPVKLAWEWKDASVIVTGGAKLEGAFWFDPSLGSVCQRLMKLSINYTVESERWDGFQFVQTTKYVNQTVEVEGNLLSPQ
ncbi:MAG: hypothetical protein N3B10_08470 [Armatimonadetes bacterium]|nr:hypothetical protein [Armatimonadota bacterium]MCX7968509.1 hypothetical protein [Armatimonadota bacterium]MDW8143257.1 hypothetical protein [Armatimonadota bacterium]